jgi:hypothetical protein
MTASKINEGGTMTQLTEAPAPTFRNETEASLWYAVYVSLRKQGAGDVYAAPQADDALNTWRQRNPGNLEANRAVKP